MYVGKLIRRIDIAFGRGCNAVLLDYGLTHPQLELLGFVSERRARGESTRPRDIEKALGVSNPTVTGLLNRLEAKGLLARESDPTDSRARIIRLTETEKALRGRVTASMRTQEERLTASLTAGEREQLEALLTKLLDGIENPSERTSRV